MNLSDVLEGWIDSALSLFFGGDLVCQYLGGFEEHRLRDVAHAASSYGQSYAGEYVGVVTLTGDVGGAVYSDRGKRGPAGEYGFTLVMGGFRVKGEEVIEKEQKNRKEKERILEN